MAVAQVASGSGSGSGTSLALTGLTCAAGNILALQIIAVNTGNNPTFVSSVSDNAAGSANVYSIPAAASTGAFFAGQNQFASVATIWCQAATALSANTVTINMSANAGVTISASRSTYSGVPAGAGTVGAASTSFLSTVSSAASPVVPAGPLNLVIGSVNLNGAASSVSNGYALLPSSFSAWLGTTVAGTTNTTFTLSASDPVWSTTTVAIGASGAKVAPLVVPQAAVMQAANW